MNYSHSHPGLKPFIFLAPFSSHLRPRCWIEGLRCVWLTGGTPGEGAMVTRGSQRRVTELSQLQASRSRQPHRNLKSFRFSTFNPPAHFSHLSSDAAGHCVTDRRCLGAQVHGALRSCTCLTLSRNEKRREYRKSKWWHHLLLLFSGRKNR